jgi:hypothetical protein
METFNLQEFKVTKQKPSTIREGYVHTVTAGVICPRCNTKNPTIEHGDTRSCEHCDLKMTVHGNALECVA